MDPLFGDLTKKDPVSHPHQRLTSASDLEVLVDSRDQAERYGALSSLSSLKDDQLLIVQATPERNPPQPKRGSYKVLISGAKKATAAPVPTHGDWGRPVRLTLQGREKDVEEAGLRKYGFNEVVSERISLRRRLPEVRHPACLSQQYSASLPSASVVICFHNEAWSTLLRTVHSVLDTAPRQHLQEILLVDDLSQHGHLKSVLSEYVSRLEGVRLIRSTKRLGVAGCRMLGAARAQGDVLVFLDSHCECHGGWLEPLLDRIAGDRSRVLSSVLDVIDWQTFQYSAVPQPHRGVFDWRLDFHWEALSEQEDPPTRPIRSPALSGVVLAVDRRFFQKIGAYDPGMGLWGAENIELSIRVWLCGGVMEVVPCSRMGHLERSHLTHTLPDDDTVEKNKIRVAETWMDAYKQIFYKRDTVAYFIQQAESSNCSDRVKLRQTLGCRNFHWFLSNIHPELYIPQDRPGLSGELYNVGTGYCADYKRGRVGGVAMDISPCSGNGNQHCDLNSQREIRWGPAGQLCFDVRGERVILSDCPQRQPSLSRQQWKMTKQSGQIVHMMTERCVEAVLGKGVASEKNATGERGVAGGKGTPSNRGGQGNATAMEKGLFLRPCSSDPRQQWHFDQLVVPRAG
ncbi:polypeptide N-acetylgalactosaminyltransferase 15-like [Megalops cyprinoides]|uniref:polypeptide N-acetylgalactosaminyltransferase 15-like n=1 Tax=Megalops cyprinoides TaxID=118141 RepID=UPI001863C80E|nr:polypeptide N-acetylgalactosaminyltransferase 15-like [Megalops cyprinoides]